MRSASRAPGSWPWRTWPTVPRATGSPAEWSTAPVFLASSRAPTEAAILPPPPEDRQRKSRPEQELAGLRAQDALPLFREQLRDGGVLTDEIDAGISAAVKAQVQAP